MNENNRMLAEFIYLKTPQNLHKKHTQQFGKYGGK